MCQVKLKLAMSCLAVVWLHLRITVVMKHAPGMYIYPNESESAGKTVDHLFALTKLPWISLEITEIFNAGMRKMNQQYLCQPNNVGL